MRIRGDSSHEPGRPFSGISDLRQSRRFPKMTMTAAMATRGRAIHARALVLMAAAAWTAAAAPAPDFSREVRPLLEQHWSYRPLKSPPLPAVKRTASVRTPVDRF